MTHEPPVPAERYLSDRFQWAAPGDQQEDAWIVRFCDNDVRDMLFTGPDAEREAWAAWERHAPGYNLYVFRLAALSTPPGRPTREEITKAIGEVDASFGYSFNMTRLVDGVATHTLTMDGFDPVDFEDRDDGYRLIEERRNQRRADAILSLLRPATSGEDIEAACMAFWNATADEFNQWANLSGEEQDGVRVGMGAAIRALGASA